jgi:hypothetical protein
MNEAKTARTKYINLDIVGFTKGRSVEAQSELVATLNEIVSSSVGEVEIDKDRLIYLPTGDGICIALLDQGEFDVHLDIALGILAKTAAHNKATEDKMRQFEVRIGLNENVDNVVTDVNESRNVAGTGINMSQRIMSLADSGQILLGQAVHEILVGREKYMNTFREFQGVDKHGNKFPVYQFIADAPGLNTDTPSQFKLKAKIEPKLSKLIAYYLGHALQNRDFLYGSKEAPCFDYAAPILLYLKALDSVEKSGSSEYDSLFPVTYKEGEANFEEQYAHYCSIAKEDFYFCAKMTNLLTSYILWDYNDCFESANYGTVYTAVSERGRSKLKNQWPDIWKQFAGAIE